VARVRAAPRLASLAGRTIGEFWNGVFKGDVTFPLIRERLQARFPDIRIVPFTEFPHAAGSDDPAQQKRHAARLAAMAKAKGCEALISGNGA
jgi:hypothetical protein